jgi:hypothetical protein
MPSDNNSAGIEPIVPRTELYRAFGKALRLYVGRSARFSYKELQRKAGVPARMIEAYRHDPDHEEFRAAPFDHVMSLAKALGPEFTADWLSLANQGAFWLPEDGEPDPARISADSAEDTATIARAAADGKFDTEERQQLRAVGHRKIERGKQLVALGQSPDLKAVA